MPTIYEIGQDINKTAGGRAVPNAKSIVADLKPEPFDTRPGLRRLSPEQIISLEVPVLGRENGHFSGFQRPVIPTHARRIARHLEAGGAVPAIEVSILEDGRALVTDGQHRGIGAVISGTSLLAVFTRRSEEEAKALFANQGRARGVNPNVLVLAGDDPYSEYVQDACTSPDHPWGRLVGTKATDTRISPNQLYGILTTYSANRLGKASTRAVDTTFDRHLCDQLADLFSAFGTKQSNPTAFRVTSLKAIAETATLVFRRGDGARADLERWRRHMPSFQFVHYQHLRRTVELSDALLDHWNKRLSSERRVTR